MNKVTLPGLFVSSTCYDLQDIRAEVRDFALSIGFEPFLSESEGFPINPDKSTVENCLRVVEKNADIFVLILGRRYGSVNCDGISITELEFIQASRCGLPKYVFVEDAVLTAYLAWKKDHDNRHASILDNPKLFDFIAMLWEPSETWIFPFKTAGDIIEILRRQIGYLFNECLELRCKFKETTLPPEALSPAAVRFLIEKKSYWEYFFFGQILKDMVDSHKHERLDIELGLSFDTPIVLDSIHEMLDWIGYRSTSAIHIMENIDPMFNEGAPPAFCPDNGEPDVARIIHLATRLSGCYAKLLEWKLEFKRLKVETKYRRLLDLTCSLCSNAISEIESYACEFNPRIQQAINDAEGQEGIVTVQIVLKLTSDGIDDLVAELGSLDYH